MSSVSGKAAQAFTTGSFIQLTAKLGRRAISVVPSAGAASGAGAALAARAVAPSPTALHISFNPTPSPSSSSSSWPHDVGASAFGRSEPTPRRDLGAVIPEHAGRFYQRELPVGQVPFASKEGKRLFREAFLDGYMENYFLLAEQFRTQDEPTFCGLSTLAMVLNSLRIDPMRTWKGAWRWFNEQNLGCCTGPEKVREAGLSFDEFKNLANCNGAIVSAHRAPQEFEDVAKEAYIQEFREAVKKISQSQERECMVVCYSRTALGQTGAGHFSPIGGYHEASDSVLILDVARFKYPPHWAPLTAVVDGMATVDIDTGRPRGWVHFQSAPKDEPRIMMQDVVSPLKLGHIPAAAGRRLSKALTAALNEVPQGCTGGCGEADSMTATRRWLQTVSKAEPQVLRQLLTMANPDALAEVLLRLREYDVFNDLCKAYAEILSSSGSGAFNPEFFPPLRVVAEDPAQRGGLADQEGEPPCGEMWVLLLLMLPPHFRAAVSEHIAGPRVAQEMARAVRGPWALPLEALREALVHLLPPQAANCSFRREF